MQRGIPTGLPYCVCLANIYLGHFDHYVKEQGGILFYLRYIDDAILLVESSYDAEMVFNVGGIM